MQVDLLKYATLDVAKLASVGRKQTLERLPLEGIIEWIL